MGLNDLESLAFLYPGIFRLLTAEDAIAGEHVEWMVRYDSEFYPLLLGAVEELGLYYSITQSSISSNAVIIRVRRSQYRKSHA